MSSGNEAAALGVTLGWTIAHALWQTTLLAVAFALWQGHARRASVELRHHVALAALVLGVAAASVTFSWLRTLPEASPRGSGSTTAGAALAVNPPALPATLPPPASLPWPKAWDLNRLLRGFAVIWMAGAFLQVVRILGGLIVAQGIRRRSVPFRREPILEMQAHIANGLGMARSPSVLYSAEVEGPATWGWRRPVVLLPTELAWGGDKRTLAALLAHELAHVRAGDFAANLVQVGIDALLFHCPGARWLSAEVRRLREYRCDDRAVALCDRVDYVRALAGLAGLRRPGLDSIALAATGPRLVDRIRRLSEGESMPHARPHWTLALMAAILVTTLLGSSLVSSSRLHAARKARPAEALPLWTCPALLPPLTPAALLLGNEFVPQDGPSRHFYCNPLLLDGQPVDWQTFTVETRGTLTLVLGDPGSAVATPIAFSLSLRRNGKVIEAPKSRALNRAAFKVDLAQALAFARVGDHLIIEPVERRDWLAKRIIELGC